MTTWDKSRHAVRRWDHAVRKTVSDAELDAFEARAGITLPQSYREFAKLFGQCELGGVGSGGPYMFLMPLISDENENTDLDSFNNYTQANSREDAEDFSGHATENSEVILRLVFFAKDIMGDTYAWAPGEVTDAETKEYAIYVHCSGYDRVASSFEEFVMVYCLGEELERWRKMQSSGAAVRSKEDPAVDARILLETI